MGNSGSSSDVRPACVGSLDGTRAPRLKVPLPVKIVVCAPMLQSKVPELRLFFLCRSQLRGYTYHAGRLHDLVSMLVRSTSLMYRQRNDCRNWSSKPSKRSSHPTSTACTAWEMQSDFNQVWLHR